MNILNRSEAHTNLRQLLTGIDDQEHSLGNQPQRVAVIRDCSRKVRTVRRAPAHATSHLRLNLTSQLTELAFGFIEQPERIRPRMCAQLLSKSPKQHAGIKCRVLSLEIIKVNARRHRAKLLRPIHCYLSDQHRLADTTRPEEMQCPGTVITGHQIFERFELFIAFIKMLEMTPVSLLTTQQD